MKILHITSSSEEAIERELNERLGAMDIIANH